MHLPFLKPPSPKNFLLLDLDETEVRTVMLSFDQENKIAVLGKAVQRQPRAAIYGYEIADLDAVLETADFALQNLKLITPLTTKDTILLTAAGTILATGLTVRFRRPQPTEQISQKELKLVFRKIEEKISRKAEEQLRTEQHLKAGETLKLLGSDVTEFRLDGTKIKTPVGLTGESFELVLLYRFIRQRHLRVLEEFLGELDLRLFALAEKSLLLARSLLESRDRGVVAVLGSRATDIVPFQHGKILGNYTFNFGSAEEDWLKALQTAVVEFPDLRPDSTPLTLFGAANTSGAEAKLKSAGWQFEILPEERLFNALTYLFV